MKTQITVAQAKEFARDYLGTLKAKGMRNTYRSVREIARIMEIDVDKANHFVLTAERNNFMCRDGLVLENFMHFPTLFAVWEANI